VVAVDCPSGVDCDSGQAAAECIPAKLTVTMAAMKRGLLRFPAYNLVGRLQTVGIGLKENPPMPDAWERIKRIVPGREWVAQQLPDRPFEAHKGTFGTVLVIAGSTNYTGAALLAGLAAYRVGAGLVTMAVPEPVYYALAGQMPEATWLILPDEMGVIAQTAWHVVMDYLIRATGLLVGPGFGLEDTTRGFLSNLLAQRAASKRVGMSLVPTTEPAKKSSQTGLPPTVIDADGLKLLANIPEWNKKLPPETILTPHPGEMSILTGLSIAEIQNDRVTIAERYAQEWGHVVILKGAFSVVASPDGNTAIIPVATSALARAGTGDVLAGLIVGLRAQGVDAWHAATCGAWIHAEAGLQAAERLGSTASVLAGDVLESVISVIADLQS
jgi:NAD(P)H-hydrate epimerase